VAIIDLVVKKNCHILFSIYIYIYTIILIIHNLSIVTLWDLFTEAANDLEKVTDMAYSQIQMYGMNKKVGLVSFPKQKFGTKPGYSQQLKTVMDHVSLNFILFFILKLALLTNKIIDF